MLKKKHTVKQKALIGGKDYRALREACAAIYGLQPSSSSSASSDFATLLADTCDVFLPKKASSSEKVTWLYPSASSKHCGANILSVNDVPLLVDVLSFRDLDAAAAPDAVGEAASKSITIPTLFGTLRLRQCILSTPALQSRWQHLLQTQAPTTPREGEDVLFTAECARLVAAICWIHPPASRHVIRGAHVMSPGIIAVSLRRSGGGSSSSASLDASAARRLQAGDAIFVCVRDNPIPFAVGIATASLAAFVHHIWTTAPAPPSSDSDTLHSSTILFSSSHAVPAGVGVVVAHSINDQLWEEALLPYSLSSIHAYQLPKDSSLVVPKSHQLLGGLQTSQEVAAGDAFPLLAWIARLQRNAESAEEVTGRSQGDEEPMESGEEENEEEDEIDVLDGEPAEVPQDEPEAVADIRRAVTSAAGDGAAAAVDVASLFATENDVLDFAAMEAAKKFPPSSLPVLLNAFVAELCSHYPRVDVAAEQEEQPQRRTAESEASPEETQCDPRDAPSPKNVHRIPDVAVPFVNAPYSGEGTGGGGGGIDFKKTSYKKALAFLTSPRLNGTFKISESSPGVHMLQQINKSTEWFRSRRRAFALFLVAHHQPVMEAEKGEADAKRLSDEGGVAAVRKWRRGIAIERVEVVYRPSRGLHPQLASLLLANRTTAARNADGTADADDGDVDDDDGGTAPAATIRSNLKQYVATHGLFITSSSSSATEVVDPSARPSAAPPLISIDGVLRQLWPPTAKDVPQALRITELEALVFHQFCPMHRIFYALPRGAHPCALPRQNGQLRNGAPPSVLVSKQRRGTKWVVVVAGLESLGFDATAVAEAWQQQFMTGAIVVDPSRGLALKSGTRMPVEVVLRGKNVSLVTTYMESTMGIPTPLIVTEPRRR